MSRFHVYVHSLLLVTSPSLLVYPQCEQSILQQVYDQEKPFEDFNLTYDDILKLLQDIEEEKLEEVSEEKIERITHFIAFLAEKGMLPGDYAANVELKNDIAALLGVRDNFYDYAASSHASFDELDEYAMLPALFNGQEDAMVFLCKHKKHKHDHKHHNKKHKDKHKKNKHQHHKMLKTVTIPTMIIRKISLQKLKTSSSNTKRPLSLELSLS